MRDLATLFYVAMKLTSLFFAVHQKSTHQIALVAGKQFIVFVSIQFLY